MIAQSGAAASICGGRMASAGGKPCAARLPAPAQRQPRLTSQRHRRQLAAAPAAALPEAAVLADAAVPVTQLADAAGGAAAAGCSGLGCAQDLLDAAAQPFVGLAGAFPAGALLPGAATVLAAGGLAAWRFAVYGRREYIVAAMLRKYVPKGGARVLQVNGSTRDVFYYPQDTVSVRVVGADLNPGLMEQAGASAGVPVEARKQSPTDLAFQGTGSVDAVVAFNGLASAGDDAQQYLSEVARVLKPGAPLVFIDRVTGQGLAAVAQPLVGSAFKRIDEGRLQELRRAENLVDITGDIALQGQDPHAVGVAFRAGGTPGTSNSSGSRQRDSGGGSDRPSAQRKSKAGGGKKKGFAASRR